MTVVLAHSADSVALIPDWVVPGVGVKVSAAASEPAPFQYRVQYPGALKPTV